MSKRKKVSTPKKAKAQAPISKLRWSVRLKQFLLKASLAVVTLMVVASILVRFVNPPMSSYMLQTWLSDQSITQDWVALDELPAPVVSAFIAAEDARFCRHWGLDVTSIKANIIAGQKGGASTISQQTVKNLFLWQGRSWVRKTIEAVWTPIFDLIVGKRRIIELYLNIAEFGPGVFGVQAAAEYYFGKGASQLNVSEAARLVSILPSPIKLSVQHPNSAQRSRMSQIKEGALFLKTHSKLGCIFSAN